MRLRSLAQDDRMVIALFDRAKIKRVRRLAADQIAQAIDIKGACASEVVHSQLGVAGAHDVERGSEYGLSNRHLYGGF